MVRYHLALNITSICAILLVKAITILLRFKGKGHKLLSLNGKNGRESVFIFLKILHSARLVDATMRPLTGCIHSNPSFTQMGTLGPFQCCSENRSLQIHNLLWDISQI